MTIKPLVREQSPVQHTLKQESVWTPHLVFWTTMLLGLPAGATLAAANWMKMGLVKKAFVGLAVVFIAMLVFFSLPRVFSEGFSGQVTGLLFVIYAVGGATYFHLEMRKDISNFKTNRSVKNAHWLGGCLIGVGGWLALAFAIGIIGFVVSLFTSRVY